MSFSVLFVNSNKMVYPKEINMIGKYMSDYNDLKRYVEFPLNIRNKQKLLHKTSSKCYFTYFQQHHRIYTIICQHVYQFLSPLASRLLAIIVWLVFFYSKSQIQKPDVATLLHLQIFNLFSVTTSGEENH